MATLPVSKWESDGSTVDRASGAPRLEQMVNTMQYQSPIQRRESRQIMVGSVAVGGGAPVAVQSMTNTDTCDVEATVRQVEAIARAGADIVRVSVPTLDAAEAFGNIRRRVSVPLVSDIHFDYRIALRVAELGVDCLRINPGNIGREDRVRAVVDSARDHAIPIRIGVNAGSLEKDLQKKYGEPTAQALVESALRHIEILDRLDFRDFKVSLKASDVFMTVAAYRQLAGQIEQPLHLGITEAGGLRSGAVKSAIGLGMLLAEGIGDTIRVSLAADPVEEVKVGFDILKALHIRNKGINLIACPSCSRQNFDVIATVNALESRLEDVLEPMDVAVIGCVVNGPGEAREAQIGLAGGTPNNLLYLDGKPHHKVTNDQLVEELEKAIRAEIERRRAGRAVEAPITVTVAQGS
jgi:(E)-4-hydroxy-3-methylbut-2-enyl-diphosphate synthase